MEGVKHSIKDLDSFGRQINFTINREARFKTVCGGFISIIILCLYIAFFFLLGKNMFYKLNPIVTEETLTPENQESYTITNETFFAWRISSLENSSLLFYDKFKSFLLYNYHNNTEKRSFEFKSINCTNQRFQDDFENSVYKADQWMCFDFSTIANHNLTGTQSNSLYSYLSFTLDICEVNMENSTKTSCADYQKLSKLILHHNILIEFLYYDTRFIAKNYTHPLERKINYYNNFLNINLMKRDTFFFQKTIVEQDAHFLLTNEVEVGNLLDIKRIENYVKFGTNEYFDEYYSNDKYLNKNSVYLCKFFYDGPYKKFSRKYQKVQDVFGMVNGCLQFLMTIFAGVYYFYCKYRFEHFIFNKFVDVKIDNGLFLNKKENEMKIIDQNINRNSIIKKESVFSKEKFDVITKSNKDINNNEVEVGDKINRQIYFDRIQAKSPDTTSRRLINFTKSEGGILEQNTNNEIEKLSKEASPDVINEGRSDNSVKNNSLSEEDKKIFIEKLEKLSSDTRNTSYLQKNLYKYICNRKDKKTSFDLKLQETYVNKIVEKFDIFYYLRLIKQFKNLKKYIFKEENEPHIFKILARQEYNVSIKDYNDDFFKEDKNLKGIIEQWVNSLKNVNQTDLSKYLFNNYQMLIHN